MSSLSTTLCLQWEPEVIAVALMFLAGKLSKFEIVDWHGRNDKHTAWWDLFVEDITMELLEDICHQVLDLYSTQSQSSGSTSSPTTEPPKSPKNKKPSSNTSANSPTTSTTPVNTKPTATPMKNGSNSKVDAAKGILHPKVDAPKAPLPTNVETYPSYSGMTYPPVYSAPLPTIPPPTRLSIPPLPHSIHPHPRMPIPPPPMSVPPSLTIPRPPPSLPYREQPPAPLPLVYSEPPPGPPMFPPMNIPPPNYFSPYPGPPPRPYYPPS